MTYNNQKKSPKKMSRLGEKITEEAAVGKEESKPLPRNVLERQDAVHATPSLSAAGGRPGNPPGSADTTPQDAVLFILFFLGGYAIGRSL